MKRYFNENIKELIEQIELARKAAIEALQSPMPGMDYPETNAAFLRHTLGVLRDIPSSIERAKTTKSTFESMLDLDSFIENIETHEGRTLTSEERAEADAALDRMYEAVYLNAAKKVAE